MVALFVALTIVPLLASFLFREGKVALTKMDTIGLER